MCNRVLPRFIMSTSDYLSLNRSKRWGVFSRANNGFITSQIWHIRGLNKALGINFECAYFKV